MSENENANDAVPKAPYSTSKSGGRRPLNKDVPELLHFEFQGAEHTVRLLTSRSSTNVVMEVDGVMHRSHVTLCEGVEQENWLHDAQLIKFAKQAIDPEYGVMTPEEIEELLREAERLRRSGKLKP